MAEDRRRDTVDALGATQSPSESTPGAPSPASLTQGTLLGDRYRVTRLLGQGGMGAVYLAVDLSLDQQVALKFVAPDLGGGVEHVRNEVRVATRVTHANVCRTYDLEEIDGQCFVKMEYIDGVTLAQHIARQGRLSVDEAVAIARSISEGLEAAHAQGVVHRDLKPQNVLLEARTGRVVLTDFGIARSAAATGDAAEGAALPISGTPEYMSPEQARGRGVDGRSDLYSLGCVLYAMLVGEVPLPAATPMARALRQIQDQPPDVRQRREGVPPWLAEVVRRLLEKEPAARLPDAATVRVALAGPAPRRAPWQWPLVAGAIAMLLGLGLLVMLMLRAPTVASPWQPVVQPHLPAFDENSDVPAITPDGAQVVYPSDRDGKWRLWLAPLRGGAGRPVTPREVSPFAQRWTRDGSALLFVEYATQRAFRMALDGTPPAQIAERAIGLDECGGRLLLALAGAPDCPKCSRLVLRGGDGGDREIARFTDGAYVMSLHCDRAGAQIIYASGTAVWLHSVAENGPPPRRICESSCWDPTFAPDGRSAIVAMARGGKTNLWELSFTGGAARQLTFGEGPDRGPEIAPDGRTLLFNIDLSSAPLFARSRADEVERRVIAGVEWASQIGVTPDGRTAIVLLMPDSAMTSDGESVSVLLDTGEKRSLGAARCHVLSVDGREVILVREGGQVVSVPLGGGPERALAKLPRAARRLFADPDGVVHAMVPGAQGYEAWRVPLAGGDAAREALGPWETIIPAPRGGWRLAARYAASSGWEGVLLPPGAPVDGAAGRRLKALQFAWAADGASLYYLLGQEVRRHVVATGDDRLILRADNPGSLAVSPDEKTIYYSHTVGHARRQVMTNFGERPPQP